MEGGAVRQPLQQGRCRFQPTGFPDLGASEFDAADGSKSLLVESAQSMANRLEATTWDRARADQVGALAALPYVRIVDAGGTFLSSSRLEAHRLASAYVMNGSIDGVKGEDWMRDRLGLAVGRPLDYRAVAGACLALDPVSLVHGVFFARGKWPWQPRIARAVTSFVEAYRALPAVSGGVKRDMVINEAKEGATTEGYGMVHPHHQALIATVDQQVQVQAAAQVTPALPGDRPPGGQHLPQLPGCHRPGAVPAAAGVVHTGTLRPAIRRLRRGDAPRRDRP